MTRRIVALAAFLGLVCTAVPLIGGGAGVASPLTAGRVHKHWNPTKGKIFVLVIGNDARGGNPDQSRADAIHIVGLNTKTMRGGILNFPRDSWVNIPGHGSAKINEALQRGGPRVLAQTLENITGIRIDYWVMTGFEGFRGIMHAIGGVEVRIPFRLYDPSGSGINIGPGRQVVRNETALAYVRTRHSFPQGDVARTTNQASFLLSMLRKLHEEVRTNPAAIFKWLAATRRYTRFDMSAAELFELGVLASEVSPRRVGMETVPVSIGSIGAASVVFISSGANSIYARFRQRASL